MSPERWQRAKRLFDQALERSPESRTEFLHEACGGDRELLGEVTTLLVAHRDAGSDFSSPPMGSRTESAGDPLVGRNFGPYRVIRAIGRGGMGSVYMGARADDQFRRLVAIKVVRPEVVDEHTLRRFQNERQTLAALDHPNIIKLLDGGATEDGLPYLVMDYTEGQPIDRYCEDHNLPLAERLQLFRAVCAAVHYAHQNLVVHRDLKPGNILVTPEGVPKLLDFGIAKLLKPEYSATMGLTKSEMQPMTPEYASPEQVMGRPVTTASDIYSLGVLLYLMLTGRHPYELKTRSALELERAICGTEPEKPSLSVRHTTGHRGETSEYLSRRLRGDLDMIVLMALRKEPQRRYPSAAHLSEDIRRYLEGLPVTARKDTVGYRCAKFVTRHKAGVAGAAVVAAALLVSTWIAHTEKSRAQRRFQDLRQFANFVITDLDDALRAGATPAREKLVAKAMVYLDGLAREASRDPAMQRDLITGYLKMGDVQGNLYGSNLGRSGQARESYRKALAIAEELLRADPGSAAASRDVARACMKLGDLAGPAGERSEALESYRKALRLYEALRASEPSNLETLRSLMSIWSKMGYTQGELGDPSEAMESFRRCRELAEARLAAEPDARSARYAMAFAKERLAYFSVLSGEPARAEEAIRESLETYQQLFPKPTPGQQREIALAYKTMAEVQRRLGKTAPALESCRRCLSMIEDLLRDDPKNALAQIDLGQTLVLMVKLLPAAETRAETVRALRFLGPLVEQSEPSQIHLQNYAWLLLATPDPALRDDAAALRCAEKAVALTHQSDPEALDLLARAYARTGDAVRAFATEQKAIALLPPVKPGRGVPELRKTLEANLAAFQAETPHHQ